MRSLWIFCLVGKIILSNGNVIVGICNFRQGCESVKREEVCVRGKSDCWWSTVQKRFVNKESFKDKNSVCYRRPDLHVCILKLRKTGVPTSDTISAVVNLITVEEYFSLKFVSFFFLKISRTESVFSVQSITLTSENKRERSSKANLFRFIRTCFPPFAKAVLFAVAHRRKG